MQITIDFLIYIETENIWIFQLAEMKTYEITKKAFFLVHLKNLDKNGQQS